MWECNTCNCVTQRKKKKRPKKQQEGKAESGDLTFPKPGYRPLLAAAAVEGSVLQVLRLGEDQQLSPGERETSVLSEW